LRLSKAIKKVAAVGIGASMIGATLFGAAAANLSEYPSPFVMDGKFNGILVVGTGGTDAAGLAADIIGVTDIISSLQFASTTPGTGAKKSVTVQGDSWKVGTATKKFEISNEWTNSSGSRENFKSQIDFIDDGDLDALKSGSIDNTKGNAAYNQYLRFRNTTTGGAKDTGYVVYKEDSDNNVGDFLFFKSSQEIAQYEDSSGSITSTGTYLTDYEDETVTILGKEYTIVKARVPTSGQPWGIELTLMGGAVKDILQEGETKTYTIAGKPYEVTVDAITDQGTIIAKFTVNGESTKSISDGDSDKLADGTEIGVTDLIPNEAGDVTQDLVEFFIGAQKLVLKDTNISVTGTGDTAIKVNDESIDGSLATIKGTSSSTEIQINNILVNMESDDDYYVPAGKKLSEVITAEGDEKEILFTNNWDIEYLGLEEVETEEISIKTSGKDKYKLSFMDWGGNLVQAPLAYTSGAGVLKMGDDDDDFIINESRNISKDDYFVITDSTKDAGERPTYLLRYKGADKSTDENPKFKIENVGSKETLEKTYTAAGGSATATFNIGGGSYKVENHEAITGNDFSIKVDLDGDATINESNAVSITTRAGAQIQIGGNQTGGTTSEHLADKLNVTIFTPDSDDYEDLIPGNIQYNISSTSDIEVDLTKKDVYQLVTPDDEDNVQYGYTSLGAFIKYTNPSSDPDELIIDYPEAQRLPQVYITSGASSSSGGVGAGSENVNINKIEVGAAKLDKDVSSADLAANNVLSIGGSCVNAISAEIMGLEAGTCGAASGIPQNKALIKLFENGEKVSMVIAGWTAEDTQRASRVLANYEDYALSGMEVEVTGTSLSDISVGAPSPVMEEEEAPAEDEAAE